MKIRIFAILLCAILLLSSCASNTPNDTETESNTDSSAIYPSDETIDDTQTPPSDGEKEEVKTLTDTDTPDKNTKISLTYDSYDRLGLQYATGALGALYDGDINSRLSFFTPDGATAFNVSKLDGKKQIKYIKLFCAANYERNVGLELQASVDGIDYVTLYTLTAEDVGVMETAPLIVEVENTTKFGYFRVYHKDSTTGYDLNEVELYTLPTEDGGVDKTYEKVIATYQGFGDGNGGQRLDCAYGDSNLKFTEDVIKAVWDGNADTVYCNYISGNVGSWTSASFAEATVIGKLVLSTIWNPTANVGTAIQASVDGETWVTLYTISSDDGSFVEGKNEWKLETLEIMVEDSTAYNYVRVYDGTGTGYCLAEVEIYKLVGGSAQLPVIDTEKYPPTTVGLNNSVAGVKILGERNLASTSGINCDWSCSGIEIKLNCAGDVSFAVSSDKACYFRAYVDGVVKYNGSTPYYTVNGNTTITLKNLSEGEHTIRLIKVTGWTLANAEIKSVTFNGTMSETAPEGNDYYIEFVGDSITCAWGTIGPGGGSYEGQDGTLAFSYLIAKEQNADYSMTALSGQGLLCGTPGVPLGYEYASWKKDSTNKYDFARQADMVVINIGTNDFYQKDDLGIDADDFKAAYKVFLEMVKEKNGDDCKILCVYGCMNDNFGETIKALCKEMGGADAGYYCQKLDKANSHANGSGHPTAAEEAAYADVLNPMITAIRNGTYATDETVEYVKVKTNYHDFGDGNGGQSTNYIYGTKAGNADAVKLVWDGVVDTTYCNYYQWEGAGSWTSASFDEATVIKKVVLHTIWKPANNLGTAVQASVDGETWVTLYTISEADGSFVEGNNEWKLEALEIAVDDATAYNYIRVYDTTVCGYCLAEVEVYTVSQP